MNSQLSIGVMAAVATTLLFSIPASAQSTSTVTQNGKTVTNKVGPGESQTITRSSGGNSSTVSQNGRKGADGDDAETGKILNDMRKNVKDGPFRRFLEEQIKNR